MSDTNDMDSETEFFHEKMRETTERMSVRMEQILAYALYAGYDGVDIYMPDSTVHSNPFGIRFKYEVWKGDAPRPGRIGQNVTRYSLRGLPKEHKRMLLARIGVELEHLEDK